MDQFIQYTPTEVVFGKETENQAGAEVKKWGGTKVLVVYGGGSAKRSGLLDRVEASLAKEGLAFEELGGVKPNPRLALAEEGVKKAVEMQADFILAVGGGSSIVPPFFWARAGAITRRAAARLVCQVSASVAVGS